MTTPLETAVDQMRRAATNLLRQAAITKDKPWRQVLRKWGIEQREKADLAERRLKEMQSEVADAS